MCVNTGCKACFSQLSQFTNRKTMSCTRHGELQPCSHLTCQQGLPVSVAMHTSVNTVSLLTNSRSPYNAWCADLYLLVHQQTGLLQWFHAMHDIKPVHAAVDKQQLLRCTMPCMSCKSLPARPLTNRRPPVAPYKHVLPTREDSPGLKVDSGGGVMLICPPAMPLPT